TSVMTNVEPAATMPISEEKRSLRRGPQKKLMMAPSDGRRIISGAMSARFCISGLAFHQVQFIDVDALLGTENRDNQRQTDSDFRSGDGDDEETKQLPIGLPPMAAERDQRKVSAVQHQLDRHEHDDRVAAQQDAQRAEGE